MDKEDLILQMLKDLKVQQLSTQKDIEKLRGEMIERFNFLDKRIDRIENKLERLEEKLERLEDKLDNKTFNVENKLTSSTWHNQIITASTISIAVAVIYSVLK